VRRYSKLLQQILDSYGSGIQVTDINLQQVEPPGNVLEAFRDVQAASADKERATNEANAYLAEVVQQAEGEAARIRNEAEAYKAEKIALATGEAARFLSVLEQYKNEKDVTRRRIYLETMRGVMGNMEKVLIDNSSGGTGVVPYLPLPEIRGNSRRPAVPPQQPPAGTKR
jgi:membrane protease subunit HflK